MGCAGLCNAQGAAPEPVLSLSKGAGQATSTSSGQAYPNRPLRIVTSEAGGGNDLQARMLARGLSSALGQQVIVENRPSGVIPDDIVARANANGYTLF